jgi:hypothetical protein
MRPAQCDATAAALSLDGRLHRLLVAFLGSVRIGTLSSKPGPRLGLIDAIEVRATLFGAGQSRATQKGPRERALLGRRGIDLGQSDVRVTRG